jgi:uncharacterized membrane protein YoaK (UPF0700 family)
MNQVLDKVQKAEKNYILHESIPFGILLSIIGGFLDAYTYISRHGVFANAQTGNIVLLGIHASKGEWKQVMFYLPPIFAFILGVILVETIKKSTKRLIRFEWEQIILILESIILFILGFVPPRFPDIAVTVTIAFVASVQVCSFSKLVDSAYATTMMTGNLRKFSTEAYLAIVKKDHESGTRAVRYLAVILSFIFGAFAGGLLTSKIGVKAVWGVVIILICLVVLIGVDKTKSN